jgi:hypothetical protein
MLTAQEVYTTTVAALPTSERLRSATLILEGITENASTVIDSSDEWTEEDMRDAAVFSAAYATKAIGEE